ncbi:hypothetical protein GQ457_18G024450 [Hibiscus cannabinus]
MCHKVEKVFNLVAFLLRLLNVTSPCVRQAPRESEKKNKAETSRSHADQALHDVRSLPEQYQRRLLGRYRWQGIRCCFLFGRGYEHPERKDATGDFEDAGHNETAKELMQSFCICELNTSSSPIIPELEISSQEYSQKLMDLTKQYQTIPWQSYILRFLMPENVSNTISVIIELLKFKKSEKYGDWERN